MKIEGGFLPALLGFLGSTVAPFLLKTVLPTLATGALGSLASAAVSKAIGPSTRSALYIKNGEHAFKVVPAGLGLYLTPWQKGSSIGSGLYMKTRKIHVNGKGLLLRPDSPFKNIPLIGLLL